MRITLEIPDDVLACLSTINEAKLQQRLLESLALVGYENNLLTQRQVMSLLAIGDREELWRLFQINNVPINGTIEDI